MQGFPDPYSGLAQGLNQGVQTGANIMQMVYQKAQAAKASEDKDLATALELLKDPNAPETFKNDIWKASARPILQKRFPKAELPETYEWEDSLPKQISAIQTKYGETNPEVANKMIKEIIAGSSDPVKSMAKFDTLLKSNEASGRKIKWGGTPPTQGLAAPSGYNPDTIDKPNTMYGLTGNIPGTPGVSGLSTSYPEDQRAIVGENYIQKGELPLPKDEKETYSEHIYQTSSGEYRKGLYSGGKMVTDLGKATEKDIKYKAGEEDSDAEIKSRLKIKNLVYGGLGAKYDMLTQSWVYPPNFDYAKAQRQEAVYLKKAGLEPITGDLPEIKGDASKHMPLQEKGNSLDKATAMTILKEAGGDKERARQIAKERGYQF